MVKSNIMILAAERGIRFAKEIQVKANISWDIVNKLYTNTKVESIRIGNLITISEVLDCELSELLSFIYPYKIDERIKQFNSIKVLMALNDIDTIDTLIQMSGVSWSVINKLIKHENIESLELGSVIKVAYALRCPVLNLINPAKES